MKFVRFLLALCMITVSTYVPRPAQAAVYSYYAPMGPSVIAYWSDADIQAATAAYDVARGAPVGEWWPISNAIAHRWWSIDATPGSPNEWMEPNFAQWTDPDFDTSQQFYGWSQPTLQAYMYDTWRVDSIRISQMYQNVTELIAGFVVTAEVVIYYWGPELPGDQLEVFWTSPDSVQLNDSPVYGSGFPGYTYYPGCPMQPTD